MSVTDIHKDPEQLTMTVVTELDAPVDRAWQLWADPRKLERWWGPPTYPATFVDHDLTPGGRCSYYMTGPGGRPAPRVVEDRGRRRTALARARGRVRRRARGSRPTGCPRWACAWRSPSGRAGAP